VPVGARDAVHFVRVGFTKALAASGGDDWRATAKPALPSWNIQGKSPRYLIFGPSFFVCVRRQPQLAILRFIKI